nr:39K [Darna trima granulovirus]
MKAITTTIESNVNESNVNEKNNLSENIDNFEESNNEEGREYFINIKNVHNRDVLMDTFNNSSFKQMMLDKRMIIKLKPEININQTQNYAKKKKAASPYVVNSFIIYTSFLSKANIKLKKDSRSWQLMGFKNEDTNEVYNNGYDFRQLIVQIEKFHKNLNIDNDVVKTSVLRKSAVNYAQTILSACYKNDEIPLPSTVKLIDASQLDETDYKIVEAEYLLSAKELYNYKNQFQRNINKFKEFIKTYNLLKTDSDSEDGENESLKRKKNKGIDNVILKRRNITTDLDMVDDDNVVDKNLYSVN